MWFVIAGLVAYAGVLLFTLSLCRAASQAERRMERCMAAERGKPCRASDTGDDTATRVC